MRLQRSFGLGSGKLLIFLDRNHPKFPVRNSCQDLTLRGKKKRNHTLHTHTLPDINSNLLCDGSPGLSEGCFVHLKQFRDTFKLSNFFVLIIVSLSHP